MTLFPALAFAVSGVSLALPVPFKLGRPFAPDIIPDSVFHAGPRNSPKPPPAPQLVTEIPGFGSLQERSYAGYLPVNASCGSYLYFWLVESQNDPKTDPLLLWLNGGPGSSSFLGAMVENGPFLFNKSSKSVYRNPYSWNRNATYVMFDQPAGVGYSFVEERACYAPEESVAMDQLYNGLKELVRLLPVYANLPLFVFGESYAGKYVPELATRILNENVFTLGGIGLGDAWVDPKSLQMTYAEYAYSHGLLSPGAGKEGAEKRQQQCFDFYNMVEHNATATPDDWRQVDRLCNQIEAYIVKKAGGVNVYDVRSFQNDGNYDFQGLTGYLRTQSVRNALRVDPRAKPWSDSDDTVAYLLEAQEQRSSMHLIPNILNKTRVLVYSGVFDMDCNFIATDQWLSTLDWPENAAYKAKQRSPWRPCGEVLGHGVQVGNLTQLLILGAGHLVPMNQGGSALAMVDTFLSNRPFLSSIEKIGIDNAGKALHGDDTSAPRQTLDEVNVLYT